MKTVGIEQATLETCVDDARRERIVVTRNGAPVALIVGIEGMDEEQVTVGTDAEFWKLIGERRQQKTLSRAELVSILESEDVQPLTRETPDTNSVVEGLPGSVKTP